MPSIKNSLITVALILVTLVSLPLKAEERSFNQIIFFGDSLSDNGNLYHRLFGYVPESPPYYQGRFSNGQTWAETVAKHFKQNNQITADNYAVAGSTAVIHSPLDSFLPYTLGMEVDNYLVRWLLDSKDKTLYILWIGGNDYIAGSNDVEKATDTVIASIKANVERLISHGGSRFLLMNLPDLSKSPAGQPAEINQNISDLTTTHNRKLAALATELQTKYPEINIRHFDVYSGLNDLIENPEKYNETYHTHITNTHDACWSGGYRTRSLDNHEDDLAELSAKLEIKLTEEAMQRRSLSQPSPEKLHEQANQLARHILSTPDLSTAYEVSTQNAKGNRACADPNSYVFWDKMHPTAAVHSIFSAEMIEFIKANYP